MVELGNKIIGSVLLTESQDERDQIFREVEPSFFENELNSTIFKKLKKSYLIHPKADSTAWFESLTLNERQEAAAMMDEMISPVIVSERLPQTLVAFREDWQRRKLKSELTALSLADPTVDDVRRLAEVAEKLTATKQNAADQYLAEYKNPIEAIGTGFYELDKLLGGGFLRSTNATIGARPSTGKTTYAINIATYDPSLKVLFISIEMTARMIYDRIISNKANVKYNQSVLHLVDFDIAKEIVERYPNLMIVDDVSDIEQIEQLIYGEKWDLVFIDYIQIVTSQRRFSDNRQRIDYISQRVKAAAKKTTSCIINLSQITRGGKDKPTMSDLKESGGLEQDSDYIILLYREYVNNKENHIDPKDTIITLDKNKFGNTGELHMDFIGIYQRFIEAEDVITHPVTQDAEEESTGDLPF